MNKILLFAGLSSCLAFFIACDDYLDRQPDDKTTEEQVFSRYEKVEALVTDLYANSKSANSPLLFLKHFSISSITDECSASSHEEAIPHQFHVGNYGASQGLPGNSEQGQYWNGIYSKIRKANVILEGVAKYNTPDNPQDGRTGDLKRRLGEVYYLRGYLHYLLLREYGEIPYVSHVVNPGDDMDFKKISVHDVVEKICADADSAYCRVDGWNGGQYFGRVDKGACLGLIAMVRWMAATPLWNGGTLSDVGRKPNKPPKLYWIVRKMTAPSATNCMKNMIRMISGTSMANPIPTIKKCNIVCGRCCLIWNLSRMNGSGLLRKIRTADGMAI